MSEERKAQLSAARNASEAAFRQVKNVLITNREELIDSPEFRRDVCKGSNSLIGRTVKYVNSERAKQGINADGSKMSVDDEIQFRIDHAMPLTSKHTAHMAAKSSGPEGDEDFEETSEAA